MTAEQIKKDMVAAAKAGDKEKKLVLSAMYGAVKKLAIDEGSRDNITEDQVGRALTKDQRVYIPLQSDRRVCAEDAFQG